MKICSMIMMLFVVNNVLCMNDPVAQYIKYVAKNNNAICKEVSASNKCDFSREPDVVFDKFYEIFDLVSERELLLGHIYALFSALGQASLSETVAPYVINRICKHVSYLRSIEGTKEIKEIIEVADDVISCIPYAGMTLCVYGAVRNNIPSDVKQKTYDFVTNYLREKESSGNNAPKALLIFMEFAASRLKISK